MIDPEDMPNVDPLADVPFEYFQTLSPDDEDIMEEVENMGCREGRRAPTVDDRGQGLNSDETE